MSTRADNVQNDAAIDLGEGVVATPNGDGTYTVSGGNAEDNGVWAPATENTENAVQMEAPGTQFDGTWWVKQ